jgi:HEAT repeat protein
MTRRRLLVVLVLAVLVSLPLLHPYPRQAVFGPTLEGRPLCYWQETARRNIAPDEVEDSWSYKLLDLFGIRPQAGNQEPGGLPLSEPEERRTLLVSLLGDPSPRVRAAVAKALGALPPSSETIAGLTALLADPNRDVRMIAVASLTKFRPRIRAAIPKLTELLEDEDSEICVAVAEFIASSRSERKSRVAFMTFRELLRDADPAIRVRAVHGLHRTAREGDDIFPKLVGCCRDPHPAVRRAALVAMWEYGSRAMPLFVQALQDDDASVRREALMILGSHGRAAREKLALIVPLLHDPARDVADAAEKALAQIGSGE